MSKTTSATNKAAKVNLKGMTNPAPATKTTAASRKTTISFADQHKEKTWKCKLVLSWTISVKYNENSTTKAVLEMLLGKILKYLRETADGGESCATILPRLSTSKDITPILPADAFPEHTVTWEVDYAEMDPKAYSDIYTGKSKEIQGCFTVGFNVEGERFIKRAANDLELLGAKFTIKPVQQLKTDSTMAFLGIPITANPSVVEDLVNNMLKALE